MRIPSYLYIIPFLLSFNLASAQNIVTVIYALNHRGELFWRKSTDTQWTKAPNDQLLEPDNITPHRHFFVETQLAAGPSVNKEGKQVGQLYRYFRFHKLLWQAQDVTIENPCGTSWSIISCPYHINSFAASRSKLFISGFAKDIFDSKWQIQPLDGYNIVSISPDLPEIAIGLNLHKRTRFLEWSYYSTIGYMFPDTGKWTDTGKEVSSRFSLPLPSVGVRGSCILSNYEANANILDKNEQWVRILPPPSLDSTLGFDDNFRQTHSKNSTFAIGLTTDQYGNVINEIWRSDHCIAHNDIRHLYGDAIAPVKLEEYAKNALWRRTGITVDYPFGGGWELVETHAGNEPTGIITSLAIGSFDQTEAIKEEQRKAAQAAQEKKAAKAQELAKKKAEQKKAAAEKRKEEEKRWDAAQKRKRSLSPEGLAAKKQKSL